jgi:nucleoside-diphosphate-sugar epimerase
MFHAVYGMEVVIARIFNTYGPGMPRFVVLDFLKKLRTNDQVLEILGDGGQLRDFNYVEDTVAGLMLLALRGDSGASYNIASGGSHTVTDVAMMILKLRGLDEQTELRFTGKSWPGDAQRWIVDITRARSIGYAPKVSLNDGLARVVTWFDNTNK